MSAPPSPPPAPAFPPALPRSLRRSLCVSLAHACTVALSSLSLVRVGGSVEEDSGDRRLAVQGQGKCAG
eukprot:3256909-Rhodomonas_salina.1